MTVLIGDLEPGCLYVVRMPLPYTLQGWTLHCSIGLARDTGKEVHDSDVVMVLERSDENDRYHCLLTLSKHGVFGWPAFVEQPGRYIAFEPLA